MRWIVTDNIYAETWRQLLEFSNIELTLVEITRRHGPATSTRDSANYLKQATHARVCVLQAKEYFDAARGSSLFTSPNHAYYGAVALASLLMLVLGDGTNSLDYLRADNKNNHHGLNLTTGCSVNTATKGVVLLSQTLVEVLRLGHFANWYQILPRRGSVYAVIRQSYGTISSVHYGVAGGYNVPELQTLQGRKRSILDILKFLPDLDADLQRFGVSAVRSRTSHEVKHEGEQTTQTWTLHDCRLPQDRDALFERFAVIPRFADTLTWLGTESANGAIVKLTYPTREVISFTWPTARETLNHDTISYADAPETHEIVDLYLIAYQLSMLSRYFPDIWVSCIESQCRGAKLVERAVETIVKKLPILALSMLSPEDVVISTHREPWKS